jgi:transmembrane sensor
MNPGDITDVSSADALRVEAAEWLMQRRVSDNWTDADQRRLDAWLAESPAHLLAYWRLDAAWSRTDRLAALRDHVRENTSGAARGSRRFFLIRMMAVTALVVAAAGGVDLFRHFGRPPAQTYLTSVGGHETIRLADGSQIELNTNSAARVLDQGGRREIWLDRGEAYFQVKHDPVHPFEVVVGDREISDLGTKFFVRQRSAGMSVSVVEGRVSVGETGKANEHAVSLGAGDVFDAVSGAMTVKKASSAELANDLGWRNGLLVFYRKPLAQAAEEFNRYNREQIIVVGQAVGKLSVTGTLSATDPDQFIRMSRNLFGLQVERRNGEILISR